MADDAEVTVSNVVDKPLLDDDDLTGAEHCLSPPKSNLLADSGDESPENHDSPTAEAEIEAATRCGVAEDTVVGLSDSVNDAVGDESVADMIVSSIAAEIDVKDEDQTETAAEEELEQDGVDLDTEVEESIRVPGTESSLLDADQSEAEIRTVEAVKDEEDAAKAEDYETGVEASVESEMVGEDETKADFDEADRHLETDAEDTTNDENGEAFRELETDREDETKAEESEEDGEDITKAEDDETNSFPTAEADREMEIDGEDAETAEYDEADRQLETEERDMTKAEEDEAASDPSEEANTEFETDVNDITMAEDAEATSAPTGEANEELVAEAEDTGNSEDGGTASMLEDSPEDPQDGENEAMTAETATADTEVETETEAADSGKGSGGKRKRGKNSKSPATKAPTRKVTEEDVCFICFDGGDLVLCDRRGCPKAYHASCVNRDEAFFKAKGRWNCGWHLCSICEKNASYWCYTCTYSLCKSCIKSAVILCIGGNKGFCENCMRTVKLIESKLQGDKDAQIDFDDKSSWEYLFKDYYVDLKEKLSLTSADIAEAKSPWKGSDKRQSELHIDNNEDGGSGSDDSGEKVEASKLKRRKITRKSKSLKKEDGPSTPSNTEWASKELLEFVKHMRDGDTSVLSQFDVQDLLLKYIQSNKLRIPNKKSQIMCDARLQSLFGKPRVGHFEMLKLLESHFLIKEDSQTDDAQGTVVDTDLEAGENRDTPMKEVKDKKRKRKKGSNRGPQSNLDDYAAIDMHNIGLIYLRRKLMEDLLEDVEKFQEKVVGTFVRIRISGNNQKQDLYRLVQVMGTSKASEPYKVGKRTTDICLEIMNLNKTEVVSIDTISNQDFTEDECKRLRQSIKCGLINRPTVGVILDKAMEIHEARVNDWLESETMRLSHLRDRASEKGRRKELRECVEKLEVLKTPEERQRRLDEVPEIHADPNMDPSHESDDDTVTDENKRDTFMRSRDSYFNRRGRDPISPQSNFSSKDSWAAGGRTPTRNWESDRNVSSKNTHTSEIAHENSRGLGREREQESKTHDKVISTGYSEAIGRRGHSLSRTEMASSVPSVTSPATPTARAADTGVKVNESEKIWHYQDPAGKIQGPFSVVQLRKWNNTGYFPANLRIWRATEKQDDSILLTDALAGKFHKEPSVTENRILAGSSKVLNRDVERLNLDQSLASQNSPSGLVSSRGGMNSGEVSGVTREKWDRNDSFNLPSPTPKQGNAGWTGEAVAAPAPTSHPGDNGISDSSRLLLPANVSSFLASAVNASGQSLISSENVSAVNPQNPQPTAASEPHQDHNLHQSMNFQNPNLDPHALGTQTPMAEQSISVPTQTQPQGYGNWGGIASAVQNLAGFSNPGSLPMPQFQTNMQPPSMPGLTWGPGMPPNGPTPANINPMWGTMQQGWGGAVPGTMNMNWGGAPVQTNPNPGWVMPTGPMNPGWVAPAAGNQGMTPTPPNQGWAAPVAPNVSGPTPRDNNGSNMGKDNSGYKDGRSWNRQSSYGHRGGGGPSRGFNKRQMPCPFNQNGQCRKGSRCDYLHV